MYEVLGRSFRTETDYKLALRDASAIKKIKADFDLQDEKQVVLAIKEVKAGKYPFYTILKQDFLEELDELLEEAKQREALLTRSRKGKGQRTGSGRPLKTGRTNDTGRTLKSGKTDKATTLDTMDPEMRKKVLRELKKQENIRRAIIACSLFVAVFCFGYFGIYYMQAKKVDAYADTQQKLKGAPVAENIEVEAPVIHYDNQVITPPPILDEYKTLYSLNKRLIGWIKIDDTYIDYPVLQTENNKYYLDHNFDQEEDKNGSIFLDKDCMIYPQSTNLILYGHHMRSGRMFGQLVKYSSEDFYREHSTISFDTIYEKGTYEVMYVFRSKIYEESDVRFKYYQFIQAESETEFDSYMREMEEMSLYDTGVTAEYGDELLTLSTCDYYTNDGRFVVVAKRVR